MKKPGMSFIYVQFVPNGPGIQVDFDYGSVFEAENGRKFKVKGAIKQGGNGVVFDADELADNGSVIQQCAVKLLKQLQDNRRDRFANEVRIHQQLDNPNVSEFYGSGVVALGDEQIGIPWAAMSLGGRNLREMVSEGGLPVAQARATAIGAVEAVKYLHSLGIIHRDIKPENFVQYTHWQTDPSPCMMIDFGIAKFLDEDVASRPFDQLTRFNEFVGPQNFASPELIQYGRDKNTLVDQKSDYYQLGLLIWFLFTGRVLAGIPASRLDPTGGEVHSLVSDLVQELSEDRPSDLGSVLERLKSIQG